MPAAAGGNVQIRIEGVGRIPVEIDRVLSGEIAPRAAVPPVIFFPGIPSVLMPNPAAQADAKPGFLGVQLDTAGDLEGDAAGGKNDPAGKIIGVGILNVVEDSPAAKAGLRDGDRVLKLEGKEAKNSVQLREMIRALKPGQDVKLAVRREGKEIEIKVKLGAAPEDFAAGQIQNLFIPPLPGQNEQPAVPGVVAFDRSPFVTRSSSGGASGVAPGDGDTVSLRDGNRFMGKILGIVPGKVIRLRCEERADLELLEGEVAGLAFAEREQGVAANPSKKTPEHPKALLHLRDGSVLRGDAFTMDRGTLRFTLRGGQILAIPREQVQSAMLPDGQGVQIYDGPSSFSGWSSGRNNQGQWEYKDGLLRCIANGPIGRDLGRIPDPVDMSFDVAFPRQMQHFGVSLFSGGVNDSGIGTLTIQFSPNQISGNHYDGRRTNQYNAGLPVNERVNFSDKPETVHYRLLVDRVKGAVLIYINGVKRADWKLSKVKSEDIGRCGGAFSFTPHVSMSSATFQLGRIRLLPWNGREPEGVAESPVAKGDLVLAGDGTVTEGSIERIDGGEIHFAAPGAGVRTDRAFFVRFAAPAVPVEIPAATATVRMRNGSEFAAMRVRGDGEGMTFTTRFGTEIPLPFPALRDLEYLPRAGQGEVPARSLDALTLTDGTQYRGKALLPIAGGSLRWKIAASNVPLEFSSANVAGILFSAPDDGGKVARMKGDSVVRFANGDWLPGDVVSLEGKVLVLKTALTPELNVPLSEVHSLYVNRDVAATVADGASGPRLWSEGWNPTRSTLTRQRVEDTARSAQPWMYHDGSYTPTSASRNGQAMLAYRWPACAVGYALNFEVVNPGRGASFSVQLFNSKDERTFTVTVNGSRVYVYFNPGSARLNQLAGGGKRFQVEGRAESAGAVARVSVVLDRPARMFRVFMAGKEIGKIPFKESEVDGAFDVGGMSLNTASYTSVRGMQNRIARIWLAPWDGASLWSAGVQGASEAVIHLINGDEFAGSVEKISGDRVAVNSDAGLLELPGQRVAWIHFPTDAEAVPEHFPRLRFYDSGVLSLKELEIAGDRVKCLTLQGQQLEFPLNAVKEAVWRPIVEK